MLLPSILTFLIIGTSATSAEYIELKNVDPSQFDLKTTDGILLKNITIKSIPKYFFNGSDPMKIRIENSQLDQIDVEAFDGLDHLNALDLINDGITNLDQDTFSRLKVLEILNLDSNKLNLIKLNIPRVQELVLSDNLIEGLGENFLTGKYLLTLDLSGNKISYLNFSFAGFEMLDRVDLSRNQISKINGQVFGNNSRLAFLNVSANDLQDTEGLKLESLVDLDLSMNDFSSLNTEMFSGMINLEYLSLSGNGIAELRDPFKYLNNLKELDLSFNGIEKIEPDLFKSNFRLEKLNLNGNSIKTLNSLSTELKSLSFFYANNNQIKTIETTFFQKMTRVIILDLSYNSLVDVDGLFDPLKKLNNLNLAVNNISSTSPFANNLELRFLNLSSNALNLNFDFFKKTPNLSRIDLSNNKITDFCVPEPNFGQLIDVDLSENYIKEIKCFIDGNFEKLDAVDVRGNPLDCNEDLDDTVHYFAMNSISPSVFVDYGDDVMNVRNRPNETLTIWNQVKRELCPGGLDINVGKAEDLKESLENVDSVDSNENASQVEEEEEEEIMMNDEGVKEEKFEKDEGQEAERLPLEQLSSTPLAVHKLELNVQSQKSSWEPLLEDTYVNDIQIISEDEIKKTGYTWYTVALVLIGISLSLVCVNVAGFMYLRSRSLSSRDAKFDQTYTQLNNDVYRDTTEPVGAHPQLNNNLYNGTNNKIFLYDQVQELLLNFGFYKKGEEDSESIKKMIVNTTSNSALQQC